MLLLLLLLLLLSLLVDSVQTFDSLSCRARGKQNKQCSCMIYTCIYIYIYLFIIAAQLKDASNLISCITTKQFEKITDFLMKKYFHKDMKV